MFLMAVHYPVLERGAILCWLHYFHDSKEMTMGGLKMKEYTRLDGWNLNSLLLFTVVNANSESWRHLTVCRVMENQDYFLLPANCQFTNCEV